MPNRWKLYAARWWPLFGRDWRSAALRQLALGLVLAILTFYFQVHLGIIRAPYAELHFVSITRPYLIIVLPFALYHAVNAVVKIHSEDAEIIKDLRNQIEASTDAPDLDLLFTLPGQFPPSVPRNDPLKIVNNNDSIAYDIVVQPMDGKTYRATFKEVPRLSKGELATVTMDMQMKDTGTHFAEFELLVIEAGFDHEFDIATSYEVPVAVRFRDGSGRTYESQHAIFRDYFIEDTHVRRISGPRLITS